MATKQIFYTLTSIFNFFFKYDKLKILTCLFCFQVFLVILSSATSIRPVKPDPVQFMTQVATALKLLGRNTMCVADLGNNPIILAKAYQVFDTTVRGIKHRVHGPISEAQFADLIKLIVFDAMADMESVDARCAKVLNYCPASRTPRSAVALSKLGKSLETMGSTLSCLITNPKSKVLTKIPQILLWGIQQVVRHEGISTSVDILLPPKIAVAREFQKLSPICAKASKSCYNRRLSKY